MLSNESFSTLFQDQRLMAILRGFGAERSVALARQAWELGIDCVEVPIQSAEDLLALRAVVTAGAELGKSVGAGTVTTLEHVDQARAAGAEFTVSPGFDVKVATASFEAGMAPLPGVATASEVQAAATAGLTWLKAFPASILGTEWFKAMAGPFPQVNFVATGGMDAGNAQAYLAAGVRVVAVGSALGGSLPAAPPGLYPARPIDVLEFHPPIGAPVANVTDSPYSPLISGVCPVVETPFHGDGRVDEAGFVQVVDHLIATGVKSMMFPGFASEYYKLTDSERARLTELLLERTGQHPGITTVISVPDHSTELAVERARAAIQAGATAINILPPHMLGPSPRAVQQHVQAMLDAVAPHPAILQYAPTQTGTSLSPSIIADMARSSPNLVQVKVESAPPGALISGLMALEPPMLSVVGYAGVQLIDAMQRGASGVQPGSSFVEVYLAIWDHWSNGDKHAAIELHTRLLPYISYWMQSIELIIAAEKRISYLRGLIASDYCRAPAWQLDERERAMIDIFLEEFAELFVR